jgi:hypothetical protein
MRTSPLRAFRHHRGRLPRSGLILKRCRAGRGALRADVEISVATAGRHRSRELSYWSERAQVTDWTADDNAPIRHWLAEIMAGVSQQVWEKLLGRDQVRPQAASNHTPLASVR